jgi:hypothetical protein
MSENNDERLSFLKQVNGCITSPKSTFKSILAQPSLRKTALLLSIIAIIAVIASYNYMGKLPLPDISEIINRQRQLQQLPRGPLAPDINIPNPKQLQQRLMIVSSILMIIGVFTSWLISSSLLHVFSRVQGGKSSLRNMLILGGFASTPFLIQHTLRLMDSLTINPEQILQLMVRSQIFENQFLNAVLNSALNKFSIFWLWSISLQVIALQENYKISRTRSIITVIITFIIMVLISTFLPF